MLLAQLQEIIDIDTRISEMHRELADLYATRSSMIEPQDSSVPIQKYTKKVTLKAPTDGQNVWCRQEYDKLLTVWKKYDIALPAYRQLQPRLQKARGVMTRLTAESPEFQGNLTVLLVPPTKLLGFPVKPALRGKKQASLNQDFINSDLPKPEVSKKWQVLVVYTASCGLYLGSPETIVKNESYMMGDLDTRGLGMLEYGALSLQLTKVIDDNSWTILLKDTAGQAQLPCVTVQDGRLRFDIEDMDSVFGDNRFRPAVAIDKSHK